MGCLNQIFYSLLYKDSLIQCIIQKWESIIIIIYVKFKVQLINKIFIYFKLINKD